MTQQDLFADIGQVPTGEANASSSETLAEYTSAAATKKGTAVTQALEANEAKISKQLNLAVSRTQALQSDDGGFNLQNIISGWFPEKVKDAATAVTQRASTKLTIDSAATYGTIPDRIVAMFVKSAETEATGDVKLVIAEVLDQATGVANDISDDKNVQASQIEERAEKMLKKWGEEKAVLDRLFRRLFKKVLNRVVGYQTRLSSVGNDLAKKSVLLDQVAASLRARQQMVKDNLLETCINGLGLEAQIEHEQEVLGEMEFKLSQTVGSARGPLTQQISEQQAFVQIMIKRLVDLKSFAVKEIGLYSIIGTVRNSVAIIRADVEFTRTNLIAALGLQLGLVVDIVSTLRIAKATRDVRLAEAGASEQVGAATDALQAVSNEALLDIQTTMRSLELTIGAAIRGIQNTRENMDKVETMQKETNSHLGQMMTDMGNA
jgi:ribosomal protein S17E